MSLIARLATAILPEADRQHLAGLSVQDAGHGYDSFGAHPDWVRLGVGMFGPLYRYYFRVESHGTHHIPSEGGAILASNHSGTLPLDGAMLFLDVVHNTDPVRIPRPAADFFVPMLPFVSVLFSRVGVVGGSRANVGHLLKTGELLMVFPEGVPGISKPWSKRYQLQEWRVGHCELAIRHGVPVVPVAVVGAEEQMPQLASLPGVLGAPFVPIAATPVPLPVHYHIHYGAPIPTHLDYRPEHADDPDAVAEAALRVKAAVRTLIADGLKSRPGVFI